MTESSCGMVCVLNHPPHVCYFVVTDCVIVADTYIYHIFGEVLLLLCYTVGETTKRLERPKQFLDRTLISSLLIFLAHLVGSVGILGPLELHLEPLHANLETIHGLNCRLSTGRVVKTHKTKALALIGGTVNKDLC